MNIRKVRPSTSCKDTSNFNDYKINEVQFHHKIPVKGTYLGKVVEGIAMEIKGGVGCAFTGSAKAYVAKLITSTLGSPECKPRMNEAPHPWC